MLKEYEKAREAKDRQEALMSVATLLDKVTDRLSPRSVRYGPVVSTPCWKRFPSRWRVPARPGATR